MHKYRFQVKVWSIENWYVQAENGGQATDKIEWGDGVEKKEDDGEQWEIIKGPHLERRQEDECPHCRDKKQMEWGYENTVGMSASISSTRCNFCPMCGCELWWLSPGTKKYEKMEKLKKKKISIEKLVKEYKEYQEEDPKYHDLAFEKWVEFQKNREE